MKQNIKPATLLNLVIRPTLTELARYDTRPGLISRDAEVMLLAIAIQESGLIHRRQMFGPARSWWQIEPLTALDTLRRYTPAHLFCQGTGCEMTILKSPVDLSYILRFNDSAACAIARGILRLNPNPIPSNCDDAWKYYLSCWRPGKPRPESWEDALQVARLVVADA